MSDREIAKRKGKRPVFLDQSTDPLGLSLLRGESWNNQHAAKWNEALTYLINVFDTLTDLEHFLGDYPGWAVIWEILLQPIQEAVLQAAQTAGEEAQNITSPRLFAEVRQVSDLCAKATHKPLNDPFTGDGVLTNLAHIITLAETVKIRKLGWLEKAAWDEFTFPSLRRIWARIEQVLPKRAKPSTLGYVQEIERLSGGEWRRPGQHWRLGPPTFAVNASGDTEQREIVRRMRAKSFRFLGMKTEPEQRPGVDDAVIWDGGNCAEAQNWLMLAPELRASPALARRPRFFISCTFKVVDMWREAAASALYENMVPFCGNCRALAESLAGEGLFMRDGVSSSPSVDPREREADSGAGLGFLSGKGSSTNPFP